MDRAADTSRSREAIQYRLTSTGVGLGTGLLACSPEEPMDFEQGISILRSRPNDLFMHRYLLTRAGELEPEALKQWIQTGHKKHRGHLLALAYEACIIYSNFESLIVEFGSSGIEELAKYSPLMYIPWHLRKDPERNLYWLKVFSGNLYRHYDLPPPASAEFPVPFDRAAIDQWKKGIVSIGDLVSSRPNATPRSEKNPSREDVKELIKKLERLEVLTGWEMRPDATLSPFAVERPWNLDVQIDQGRNRLRLTGTPSSYGRGLNIHQARLSCAMEAAERYSAFASVFSEEIRDYTHDYMLTKGRYMELLNQGIPVLDLNEMCLEVPYRDQEIHWITAQRVDEIGFHRVYVPAQFVFLFSNLDEPSLTSGIPSTGFAAAHTLDEAKLSALLEVIERDAEKVMPYGKNRCFLLECDDRRISDSLEGLRRKGIQIQFLDMTTEFGIPCYKAFVQGPGGAVLKGSAAHLDGKRAALAAMTEIPYPYPYWFGSMPPSDELESIQYEDLPDYASGDPAADLERVENLLLKNGYRPIYVDLTREDLGIPVVKALVPGLEMMTVFDRFTPLGLRKFAHYLETTG